MAITGPIPLPQSGMDAFLKGLTDTQNVMNSRNTNARNQLFQPYQLELLKAQSQQAAAKALQSNMLARLIQKTGHIADPSLFAGDSNSPKTPGNTVVPPTPNSSTVAPPAPIAPSPDANLQSNDPLNAINQGGTNANPQQSQSPDGATQPGVTNVSNAPPTPTTQPQATGDDDQQQAGELLSGIFHIPTHVTNVDGNIVSSNAFTGTTVKKVGPSAREKAFMTQDAKTAAGYDDEAKNADATGQTLDQISESWNSPEWAAIKKHPILGKLGLAYYSYAGTPAQAAMVGNLTTNTGQVVADMAHNFKGSFRRGEQGLIQNMKVNTNDPIPVGQGKLEALKTFNSFLKQRAMVMSKMIRQGIAPSDALEQADQLLHGNIVRKMVATKAGITPAMVIKS